jgi:hypothetical protein
MQKSSDYFIELFDETSNVRKRNLNNKNGLDCRITKEVNALKVSWRS